MLIAGGLLAETEIARITSRRSLGSSPGSLALWNLVDMLEQSYANAYSSSFLASAA